MTSFPAVTPSRIGDELVPTTNARDLHTFLDVGRDFATWIKFRLAEYAFEEGRDFVIVGSPDRGKQTKRGGDRRSVEYHLTLDAAKELSMVERTERGRQVRRYFIECERKAKAANPALPQNLPEALRLAADLAERLSGVQDRVASLEPAAAALDRLSATSGSLCITDAAKSLKVAPGKLFAFLRANQWLYRRSGTETDVAYQVMIDAGWLEHRLAAYESRTGGTKSRTQVRITAAGLAKLAKALETRAEAA